LILLALRAHSLTSCMKSGAGAYIIPKASHCIHHDADEEFNKRLAMILELIDKQS